MSDDVAAPRGGVTMTGSAGHVAMRHTVALVDSARNRPALARLFGVTPLTRPARTAYLEALAELEVASALDDLGDGWRVIRSLPLGGDGGVVDHLVIGPAGVFVVDTSVHPGEDVVADQRSFTVAEVRLPAIRAMELEMGRVERMLTAATEGPVEVAAVLAVGEPKSLTVVEPHRDVAVIHASEIAGWFARRPRTLTAERVAAIAAAAERADTWNAESGPDEVEHVRDRFDAVRRQVEVAARVQRLWVTAITTGAVGAFVLVTYAILVGSLRSS